MTYKWTEQQRAFLSKNPHILNLSPKGRLRFKADFLSRMYEAWSANRATLTITSFLEANGLPPDIIPLDYIRCIQQKLYKYDKCAKASRKTSEGTSADSKAKCRLRPFSQYAQHPLVVKNAGQHYCLSDEFYNEAHQMYRLGFSIAQILGVYDIDASDIPVSTRNRIRQKLECWREKKVSTALTAQQQSRYNANKAKLLKDELAGLFAGIKEKIPAMTRVELKELCRTIESLPLDSKQGYGKKEVIEMCGLSKSRYYRILSDESYVMREQLRNMQDDEAVAKIRQVLARYPFPMGIRQIFMQLPRVTGETISFSRLRRLMKKYDITCKVRRPRNANKAKREWLKAHVKPNLLHRRFRLHRPGEVVLSDVTYLTYAHGTRRAYGSSAIDPVTGRLLTFCVSEKNDLALGLDTLTKLSSIPGMEQAMFHSDQGIIYLSDEFQRRVEEMGMEQSMSKRGNCWDNSPQESFFGHFKDEVDYEDCTTFKELKKLIDGYSEYYNNERCQWTRNRMTPVEYDKYLRSMTDEEFSRYLEKEEAAYRQMQETSAARAKLRAQTLGPA